MGQEGGVKRAAVATQKTMHQGKLAVDDKETRAATVAASDARWHSVVIWKIVDHILRGIEQNEIRTAACRVDIGKAPAALAAPLGIPAVMTCYDNRPVFNASLNRRLLIDRGVVLPICRESFVGLVINAP